MSTRFYIIIKYVHGATTPGLDPQLVGGWVEGGGERALLRPLPDNIVIIISRYLLNIIVRGARDCAII